MYEKMNKKFFDILNSEQRIKLLCGGVGSGKTVATIQMMCLSLDTEDGYRGLALRKSSSSMDDSTYHVIKSILDAWKLPYTENTAYKFFEVGNNRLYYSGFDIKIDFENFDDILLEESIEFSEEDFTYILNTAKNANLILTFNPIESWCTKLLLEAENCPEKYAVMFSTYKDNLENLTEGFVKMVESLAEKNLDFYNVYCLGKVGRLE